MILEELHLEITRNCTLCCEHCLRGDKQCVNMNLETLNNVFRDVQEVKVLLLTGGEPFIAINQLENLVNIIKSNGINVGTIRIITNGTIMSKRLFDLLSELSELTDVDLKVSADIFHILELERLGFTELRNKNCEILRRYFKAKEYGVEEESTLCDKQIIYAIGRAKLLTPERLNEINKMVKTPYVTNKYYGFSREKGRTVYLLDNFIGGQLTVDVNGNIVDYGLEFDEEDNFSKEVDININKMSLKDAALKYINYHEEHLGETEKRLKKLMSN